MIWHWLRRVLIGLALVLICLVGFIYFVVATESGTKWLLARTEAYMPAELALDGVGGTLLSGLAVEKLHWRDTGVDAEINELYLRIAFRPLLTKHLAIEEVSAQRAHVAANSSRTASPDTTQFAIDLPLKISVNAGEIHNIRITTDEQSLALDRIDFIVSAHGEQVSLQQLVVTSDWLSFDAVGSGRLSPPYDLDGSLKWALYDVAAQSWSGSGRISGDTKGYTVNHALSQPIAISTAGVIDFKGNAASVDLLNEWQSLQLSIADGRELQSSGGSIQIEGNVASYVVDVNALFRLDERPEANVDVSGSGSSSKFDFKEIRVDSEDLNLNAKGSIEWAGERSSSAIPLNLNLHLNPISGSFYGVPLDGAIALRTNDGKTTIDDSWLAVGTNRVSGNGYLLPEIDVVLQWDAPEIAALWPGAVGQSKGDVRLQRQNADWLASGRVSGHDVTWANYSVGSATIDGDFSSSSTNDALLTLARVQVGSVELDAVEVRAAGRSDEHEINVAIQAGEQHLTLQAIGGYQEQSWSGQLDQVRFVDGERSHWNTDSAAILWLDKNKFETKFCLQEKATLSRVCAESALQKSGESRIAASLENLPISHLPFVPFAETIDATGSLSLDLEGRWQDNILNGSAMARLDSATFSTVVEGESLVAELEHAVARATVADNVLDADAELRLLHGGTAMAEGGVANVMSPTSAVHAKAFIELADLSFVPLLLPVISKTSGTVNGELSVGGSLSAPELGGELRLSDGVFAANNAGIEVSEINMRVSQNANGDLTLVGSAESGAGTVSVNGESRIDAAEGLAASVEIKGNDFEFIRLPEWQAVASPDLRVTLDDRSARIRGQLRVPTAKVSLNTLPESAENISPDAVVHGREQDATTTRRRFDIDVQAILGDNVSLSGFGLETQLTGALRLRGGAPEPFIGTGRIELRDGQYTAYGQELKIESGALLFSGPLTNPTLDIRATREVGDVTAGLNLSGTPSNLRSTVFSEPVLSDAEALSYLIAGRPLATATDQESNRVGQAAFALGLTGADKVIAQLQSKLGLDSLVLETGDDVGRIVAGRRVGGRLLVEYGYGLVDRLGTLLLRYQLNRRLVVETTTGTTNTLDVVYSVKKD